MIRRMPNLVKFREDPDAMLVMSLEDYDESTGRAVKAAILTHAPQGPPAEGIQLTVRSDAPPASGLGSDVTFCVDPTKPPTGVLCDQDERSQMTVYVGKTF